MNRLAVATLAVLMAVGASACSDGPTEPGGSSGSGLEGAALDRTLDSILSIRGVTGRLEERLATRLGRTVDPALADVGRLLFFDPILSMTEDNSCAGCHGPNVSLNGARPIAIGVGNNGVVGPGRSGPHNLRRAPTLMNAAFYPKLMWEGRFESLSLDPFDNRSGFALPEPEGLSLSGMGHLLGAQAFTPVVSRMEMAGFDFVGSHDDIRSVLAARVDNTPEYRRLFAAIDPEIADGRSLVYADIAAALAEFTLTLVRADAPVDQYARGDHDALTTGQKRGGILFFGKARCGECHITNGYASEMFSDFDTHVLGVPQIVPVTSNAAFDGPGADEDFGLERVTGNERHRYRFRTSPLRNVGYQPSFMHNGAYRCLEDAVRHHLDVYRMVEEYDPQTPDMPIRGTLAPMGPVLDRLHDLSSHPPPISQDELGDIVAFLRFGLSDPDAHPDRLRSLVPASVPSGLPVHDFQFGAPLPACG